jgi:hypothetical protein
MLVIISILSMYVIGSLFYINKLKHRLRAYEHIWQQIEDVADKNEDGSFNINIQHLEDATHPVYEVHDTPDYPSGIRLVDIDGLQSRKIA